jgi:hypothetical protein
MAYTHTSRRPRLSDETKGDLAIILTAIAIAAGSALAFWMVQ